MKDNQKKGIGFKFALTGLKEAFLRERNFRIHLIFAFFVILSGFIFKLSKIEWMFIILMIHIVFITELVNSTIERIIDYVKPEIHPEAKIIKDISAAVVFIATLTAVIIGIFVFFPKIFF